MTPEQQSTLEAAGMEWPALRNHMPFMAHVMQLALGAFIGSLGVKGSTKSWQVHEHDRKFGENASIDIGKSQRLRKEGNGSINKVSAMRQGLARIIEKVRISWYFENPETQLHTAENACWIDYSETWSPKRVHWVSKSQSPHRCTSDNGCEDTLELNNGVARACLSFTGIHKKVAPKSKIHWLPATFHNSRWMDHCEVCHGSIEAIPVLDPVDIDEAYIHIASCHHSIQRHVWSHGWRDASFGQYADSMEGRLVLRWEVSSTEASTILRWSDSNNRLACNFCTYPWSIPEVAMI